MDEREPEPADELSEDVLEAVVGGGFENVIPIPQLGPGPGSPDVPV